MADMLPVGSENLHESTGHPDWVEVWDNWFVLPEEGRGGYVSLIIRPSDGVCWYWAAMVGFDQPLVTVLVDDLPLPKAGSLELRAPAIWTETTVLRPFEHLTTDLEAFGVALDHPADVWNGAFGNRVAVGLELDWDTDRVAGPSPVSGTDGYRLVGQMHGDLLLDEQRWQIEGIGVRDHWWGVPAASSSWRGWASRDGELINSDGGPLELDLDSIVAELPTGEVHPGLSITAWAPAGGAGRRHARALAIDDRGGGWIEIVR